MASLPSIGHIMLDVLQFYCISSGPEFIYNPCYLGDTTDCRKSQSRGYNCLLLRSRVQISFRSLPDRRFCGFLRPSGKWRLARDRFLPHSISFFIIIDLRLTPSVVKYGTNKYVPHNCESLAYCFVG
jgi:hypothetical protein